MDDGSSTGGGYQLSYAGPNVTATVEGLRSGLKYSFRLLAENDVSIGVIRMKGDDVWVAWSIIY